LCHKSSFIALTQAMKTGTRVKINQAIFSQAIVELNRQRELGEVIAGQTPWSKQNKVSAIKEGRQ
jgi:transitional endoplasmic reticulum ATPase